MSVRSHSQQRDIDSWVFRVDARQHAAQRLFVRQCGFFTGQLRPHLVDIGGRNRHLGKQRLLGHQVVRVGALCGHQALVAKEDVDALPVDAVGLGQALVQAAGRGATSESQDKAPTCRNTSPG